MNLIILVEALNEAKGYFTGGGNTFLLVKTLHEKGLVVCIETKRGKW